MEGASGQQYVVNVFGRGIAQDLIHDLPVGQVRDTYIRSERLGIGQNRINALRPINGDQFVHQNFLSSSGTEFVLLAFTEMNGYVYTIFTSSASLIRIYRDDH